MKKFADDLKTNAYAYYNFAPRDKKMGRTHPGKSPAKILSPDGFPPWVTVSYAYPPPFSFSKFLKEREVKHIVLHSFGHAWHATNVEGNWVGWLNSTQNGQGVQTYVQDGKTVFVAKGSDPTNLAHFMRFSAELGVCLNSAAQGVAHFYIDRGGNLVVVGDVNDVLFGSGSSIDKTAVAIELEEAFYVTTPPSTNAPATWKADGNPAGTGGNVVYLTYSDQQLFTLSILCKKLETAFPAIAGRVVEFVKRARDSSSDAGYTCHNWIKGSKHFDVSPHFLTQDLWDAFFALVDAQTQINPTNVWKPPQKYVMGSGEQIATQPLSDVALKSMTEMVMQCARNQGLGLERALAKANLDRAGINESAGKEAVKEAQAVSQKASNTYNASQTTQQPPYDLPGMPTNDKIKLKTTGGTAGNVGTTQTTGKPTGPIGPTPGAFSKQVNQWRDSARKWADYMAKKYGVTLDESDILAVISRESKGDPTAVSKTGYRGLGQVGQAALQDYNKANPTLHVEYAWLIDPAHGDDQVRVCAWIQAKQRNVVSHQSMPDAKTNAAKWADARYAWGGGNIDDARNTFAAQYGRQPTFDELAAFMPNAGYPNVSPWRHANAVVARSMVDRSRLSKYPASAVTDSMFPGSMGFTPVSGDAVGAIALEDGKWQVGSDDVWTRGA
jgi:hypothetical protein